MRRSILSALTQAQTPENRLFVLNIGQSPVGGRSPITDLSDPSLANAFSNTIGISDSYDIAPAQSQVNLYEPDRGDGDFGTSLTFLRELQNDFGFIAYCLHGRGGSSMDNWGYNAANRVQLNAGDLYNDNGKVGFDGTSAYNDKYVTGDWMKFDIELDGFYKILDKTGSVFRIDLDWDDAYLTASPRLIYGTNRSLAWAKLSRLVEYSIDNNITYDEWIIDWNQGEANCAVFNNDPNWGTKADALFDDANLLVKTIYGDSVDRFTKVICKSPSFVLEATDPVQYPFVSEQRGYATGWSNTSVAGREKYLIDDDQYYIPTDYFFDGIHLDAEGNELAGVDRYNLLYP